MCRYNPKIDLVFRKLFGSEENKDILLSFINSVLEGNIKLTDLTLKNPYNLADYLKGKNSILDIKATDKDGNWYDIEMQLNEQKFYGKRAIYYWSKVYSDQIETAEDYEKLKKTIGIHLLDFDYFKDERYFRRATIKDFDTNEIYEKLNYMDMYFIEMKKFHKELGELKTALDKWITFFNQAYELEQENLPKELEEKELTKAVEKLEKMYFDKKEREIYEAERKVRMDERAVLKTAEEIGMERGMERGLEKGIEKGKLEMAKKLLIAGVDINLIADSSGLSVEEIKKIKI